jgi:WD40 repeat protein
MRPGCNVHSLAFASGRCVAGQDDGGNLVDGSWLVAGYAGGEARIWDIDSQSCVAKLSSPMHEKDVHIICFSVAPDQGRISRFMRHGDGVKRLHVWDLSTSDGKLEGYEQVLGCRNEFGFEVTSAALFQDSNCTVEQCCSRSLLLSYVQQRILGQDMDNSPRLRALIFRNAPGPAGRTAEGARIPNLTMRLWL